MEHTFKMVRILTQQFQRFDPARSPQTQLQHIGTAVAALISATAVSRDPQERMRLLESLHVLAELARAISPTYRPAEMILDVLDNVLKEPGWGYDQISSMVRDGAMKDIANKRMTSKDDFFNSALATKGGYEYNPSPPNLNDDFSFIFEPDDTLEILSSLGQGSVGLRASGALGSAPIGLSPPSSQQTKAHGKLAQMSSGPLASWNIPAFASNDRPRDSYTLEHFHLADAQFDTML